jgi:hypothetical protein
VVRVPKAGARSASAASEVGEAARVAGGGSVGQALIAGHEEHAQEDSASPSAAWDEVAGGVGLSAAAAGPPAFACAAAQQQAWPIPRQVAGGKSPNKSPMRAIRLSVRRIDVPE